MSTTRFAESMQFSVRCRYPKWSIQSNEAFMKFVSPVSGRYSVLSIYGPVNSLVLITVGCGAKCCLLNGVLDMR